MYLFYWYLRMYNTYIHVSASAYESSPCIHQALRGPISPSKVASQNGPSLQHTDSPVSSPVSWGYFRIMDCEDLNFGVASPLQLASATRMKCDTYVCNSLSYGINPAPGSSPILDQRRPENDGARKRLCTRSILTFVNGMACRLIPVNIYTVLMWLSE
jgi:hypothetical protein